VDPSSAIRIERLNYLLGGVVVLLALIFLERAQTLGLLVGVTLSCINFTMTRALVQRLIRSAPEQRAGPALAFLPKVFLVLGAVAAAIHFLPISPAWLGAGFSIFLVSMIIESVRFVIFDGRSTEANGG
jgi:hypothetical protein